MGSFARAPDAVWYGEIQHPSPVPLAYELHANELCEVKIPGYGTRVREGHRRLNSIPYLALKWCGWVVVEGGLGWIEDMVGWWDDGTVG